VPAPQRSGAEAPFAISRLQCYKPLSVSGWGGRLVRQRTSLGLSQKEAAERVGVDPSTLAKWERGEREPQGAFLGRVKRFLQDGEVSDTRRAG
jgi:ribosome-binding protein aMBF1 (putative translation factor)